MSELAGIPAEFATVEQGRATVRCDARFYPLPAVYAAAYTLLGSCFLRLDRNPSGMIEIDLRPREGEDLRTAVGSLANELLSCAWRQAVNVENALRIEAVSTSAISGAMGAPGAEDLANFDFSEDAFDDPLGIARSWDDAHKQEGQ